MRLLIALALLVGVGCGEEPTAKFGENAELGPDRDQWVRMNEDLPYSYDEETETMSIVISEPVRLMAPQECFSYVVEELRCTLECPMRPSAEEDERVYRPHNFLFLFDSDGVLSIH